MFAFSKFLMICFLDLNNGPKIIPIKNPKFDENLYPINLKMINKILIRINSIK
jgi:hypothetical protein